MRSASVIGRTALKLAATGLGCLAISTTWAQAKPSSAEKTGGKDAAQPSQLVPGGPRPMSKDEFLKNCRSPPVDEPFQTSFKPDAPLLEVLSWYSVLSCKWPEVTGVRERDRVTLPSDRRTTLREVSRILKAAAEKAGLRYREQPTSIEVSRPRSSQ